MVLSKEDRKNELRAHRGSFIISKHIRTQEDTMGVKVITVNSSIDGGAPSGTIDISQNGEYNVSAYAMANVNVSGGGGGSSDFSTAEVTVVNNSTQSYEIQAPLISEYGIGTSKTSDSGTTMAIEVVLYQGSSIVWSPEVEVESVTGDGELDEGQALIYGDCTITIS